MASAPEGGPRAYRAPAGGSVRPGDRRRAARRLGPVVTAPSTTLGPIFRDRRLDRRLRRDGYVVVPFAPLDVLAELREVHERLASGIASGYYASIHSDDVDYKGEADREIQARFWPRLQALLVDHEPVVGAFMVKHPGPDTVVPPHQDWIVTDESRVGALNCWVPLTEVTDEVGPMAVLRGSHRYLRGLRGSPTFPTQHGAIGERVHAELMEEVDVPLGSAIIYENRLLHATRPNRSDATRVVAYMSTVPAGAPRWHYFRDAAGDVELYEVDHDFFRTFTLGERPDGRLLETIPAYDVEGLTFDELAERHRRAQRWTLRRRGRR